MYHITPCIRWLKVYVYIGIEVFQAISARTMIFMCCLVFIIIAVGFFYLFLFSSFSTFQCLYECVCVHFLMVVITVEIVHYVSTVSTLLRHSYNLSLTIRIHTAHTHCGRGKKN